MVVSGTVAINVPPLLRSSLSVTGQMLFIYVIFPPTFLFSTTMETDFWLWIGSLGMISIVATTFTYNKGIPHIGAGLAGILGSAELPVVLLVASALLKENVTLAQWFGVRFIILGIIISLNFLRPYHLQKRPDPADVQTYLLRSPYLNTLPI
jgi:drug/metabolite transporter (DMT)-like permease